MSIGMFARLTVMTVLLVLATALPMGMARAQAQNHAGVVVQFGDGSVTTRCVAFNEDSITGYDLLRRARLPISFEFGSMGAGVCKIGNEGCAFPNEPCFCQCQTLGAGCTYWVYSQLRDGAWTISGLGAGARQVRDGDVDGWAWGKGDGNVGIVPASVTLDRICSAGVVTPAQPTAEATGATVPPTELPATEAPPTQAPSATPEPTFASPTPSAAVIATTAPATEEPTATATALQVTETAMPMPTPTPTPTPVTITNNQQPTTSIVSYVVFGVIALGLVIGLVAIRSQRGRP